MKINWFKINPSLIMTNFNWILIEGVGRFYVNLLIYLKQGKFCEDCGNYIDWCKCNYCEKCTFNYCLCNKNIKNKFKWTYTYEERKYIKNLTINLIFKILNIKYYFDLTNDLLIERLREYENKLV